MSGFPGAYGAPPASPWQEHHTADGRPYYYNSATKVTQWTKPEEMMSPSERALANQPWKEYTAEGGRKYWYNTETKQSSWDMPEVYRNAIGATDGRGSFAASPSQGQAPAQGQGQSHHRQGHRDQGRGARESRDAPPDSRHLSRSFVPATDNGPEYATKEEAMAAFVKALKRNGVQADWTWDHTVEILSKDPQFKAIKNPRARKEAFTKYCQDMVLQERERAQERFAKLRADFETMLKRHPDITYNTRWSTARPIIEGETIFRSTDDEEERVKLFYEYTAGLKKAHEEQQRAQRKAALDGLRDLLPKLNITAYTTWADGRDIITDIIESDPKYKALSMSETMTKFQDHIKSLERSFNEKKQMEKKMRYRRERRNRDAFRSLLASLRREGRIKAGTKWRDIYPAFETDERYLNMLNQEGPTPVMMFWDVLVEEERALRGPRTDVLDVLEDKRFEVTANTTLDEFMSIVKDDRRTARIEPATLELIFERVSPSYSRFRLNTVLNIFLQLREKRAARRDDERHSDRHVRHAVDSLRSALKRLEPPIVLGDTYDHVRPRLVKLPEFLAVPSEEAAKSAFERHMRRLKEKAEDESGRAHRRSSFVSSERDAPRRNRDRSRGERSHRGGRSSRRSRSPEQDPYEADRRRAIAERERNHRKSTLAEGVLTGDRGRLSPPPRRERDRERERERDRDRDRDRERDRDRDRERDRDHRERDRDYDRYARSRRSEDGHYPRDRDRRERDEDRERPLRRPVDTRSVDELNYGDEAPAGSSGSRRRRPDDEDGSGRRDSRDSKRIKTEQSQEATPQRDARQRNASPPAKEARDVRSGSEEGEIEE
ncbi:formin binding protein (FNB3) [Purpureocillium lilacinum]|uniref:Formin binding protein (FNB3) n=1 Tax=Purpureocillium lilacinum TaxID=33203 RepID=A0A179HL46_PURLI|nr:formin binding protein (FNB3) [Purpureocillium lilacinum]OAQ91136.1 formin binding protein (FNB3) [Purpureocillium lilacinum]